MGTEVAVPEHDMTGMEDFDPSTDIVTPRITIDGSEAKYVDGLTGQKFDAIDVIILGIVKQRALWPAVMGDTPSPPLCKSYNFHQGNPTEKAPWEAMGLSAAPTEGQQVDCESCPLSQWGSHPKRDKVAWCEEQHVYAVLLKSDQGAWTPAMLTLKRSGIKPSKTYMTGFFKDKVPMFTAVTHMTLEANRRGTVNYAVPVFAKGEATDAENAPEYRAAFFRLREFIQTPRDDSEGESTAPPSTNANARPLADDDEEPF